jgi:hypothetical protein
MTDLLDNRMDDRMDQRLSEAGRRWQAEQPPSPAVPLERLDEASPRRVGWGAALAAAAAVLVVGGGAVGVVRVTGSHSAPPSGQPTSSKSVRFGPVEKGTPVRDEVVPWRPLTARHPKVGHRVHGQLVTPYDGIVASGHISGHLHPGDTLVFVVTLESDTGVVLDPCPDFDIAFGRHASYQGQLNCAQVPYRSGPSGRHVSAKKLKPYLPAGRSVKFEMRMRVPDEHGRQKVLWTLDGPESSPGFYGIVRVTPPQA